MKIIGNRQVTQVGRLGTPVPGRPQPLPNGFQESPAYLEQLTRKGVLFLGPRGVVRDPRRLQ